MKKLKIAIITTYAPENTGGAEVVWHNITNNLNSKIIFHFFTIYKSKYPYLPKNVKVDSLNLKFLNFMHLAEILLAPLLWKKISKHIKDFDLVFYDKILGWPMPKLKEVKKIAYDHGNYAITFYYLKDKGTIWKLISLFYKYIIKYFEKKSYTKADKIIAVSKSIKEELTDFYNIDKNKIKVIPNGIDIKKYKLLPVRNRDSLRRKYGLFREDIIILFPARASYGKGFDIILKIAKKFPEYKVLITSRKIKGKFSENIFFIGKQPLEEMIKIYNISNIVIFPSRYEGCSLALLEAAACSLPILASSVGILSTFKNKKIKKYICKNFDDYVKKIKLLVGNKSNLNRAKKIWKNFVKKYTIKKQIGQLTNIIKSSSR